jgi:hypothetical protein
LYGADDVDPNVAEDLLAETALVVDEGGIPEEPELGWLNEDTAMLENLKSDVPDKLLVGTASVLDKGVLLIELELGVPDVTTEGPDGVEPGPAEDLLVGATSVLDEWEVVKEEDADARDVGTASVYVVWNALDGKLLLDEEVAVAIELGVRELTGTDVWIVRTIEEARIDDVPTVELENGLEALGLPDGADGTLADDFEGATGMLEIGSERLPLADRKLLLGTSTHVELYGQTVVVTAMTEVTTAVPVEQLITSVPHLVTVYNEVV